jgi:hypothetical protein
MVTKWPTIQKKRTNCPVFECKMTAKALKKGLKKCLENDHSKNGWSGFWMLTVFCSLSMYSKHPHTELPSVFELHLMPVPGI